MSCSITPVENLGAIADALEGAALAWQYVRVYDGQPVPASMKGAGGLIVMGGPMGVDQTDRLSVAARRDAPRSKTR